VCRARSGLAVRPTIAEWSRDLCGRGDSDRRKLAGDVAALANTAGGVIILGIEEDDQARATGAPGVELSDAESARIRQIVASLVAPVPMFDILTIPMSTDESTAMEASLDADRGFIVIAVPRSPQAPHAVLVNNALRYPKRNGATTRYLSEPEVATAYYDRLAGREARTRRVEQIEHEAVERFDVAGLPWAVVSLVRS
jgi:predicted HTH transcriptional regulator